MKCDIIDGRVVNGLRQPIIISFVSDKPSGYKVLCQTETVHNKHLHKPACITLTFYLQDHDHNEVNFNGGMLTFTLYPIKR